MSVAQRPKPLVSTMISVNWARTRMLGMKFGTPIPTMVRVCYHPDAGHWLEFMDGTDADAVAQEYPDEIRQARLEMMQLSQRRDHITTTFRRQAQYPTPLPVAEPKDHITASLRRQVQFPTPLPVAEPTTRIVAPAAQANPVRQLPVAKPITLRLAKPAIPVALPVAQPAPLPTNSPAPTLTRLDAANDEQAADIPPAAHQAKNHGLIITEQVRLRLAHLVAASTRPPSPPPTTDPLR